MRNNTRFWLKCWLLLLFVVTSSCGGEPGLLVKLAAWPEGAENDVLLVGRSQRVSGLPCDASDLAPVESPRRRVRPVDSLRKALTAQELHHQIGGARLRLPVVGDLDQARMLDAMDGPRLVEES